MDDFLKVLGKLSPTIGTALGGPVGGALGLGVKTLVATITGEDDADKALELLKANPELMSQLEMRIREIELETLRVHANDRDSARKRQMIVKDKTPAVLAVLTLASFFGYIGVVTFLPSGVIDGRMDFINLAVGWLGGSATSVVAYYFGSSAGSRGKDGLLAKMKS